MSVKKGQVWIVHDTLFMVVERNESKHFNLLNLTVMNMGGYETTEEVTEYLQNGILVCSLRDVFAEGL